MAGYLHELQNNEAVLLMYLADELSAEDRAEVEQMLRTDGGLRAMLDELRDLHERTFSALAALDEDRERGFGSADAVVRRTLREMRRRQLELAARPAPVPRTPPSIFSRWPWYAYAAASVAASIFVVLGLWGVGIIDFRPSLPGAAGPGGIQVDDVAAAEQEREEVLVLFDALINSLDRSSASHEEQERPLREIPEEEDATAGTFPVL